MIQADQRVRQILDHLEPRIDLDHVTQVRARQRAGVDGAADSPPIVFYLPYQGQEFVPYPYPEAYADPAKMMVNELLIGFTSICHAVDLRDDAPYCLRPNLGTGIIASQFGAEVRLTENNMPWVMPLAGVERIRALVDGPLPDARSGLVARALEQYDYFCDAVQDYPHCRAAFEFTLPDLQGPFSIAELLWGSHIYTAFYDEPDLIRQLLARITDQIIAVYRLLIGKTRDHLGSGYCYQHGVAVKGDWLIRDDSMVNLSPRMYRDIVLPFDRRLGQAVPVGIHFCGNAMHQVENLLQIENLGCIDLGNPEKVDLDALYRRLQDRRIALLRVSVPAEELRSIHLKRRFPGAVNVVYTPKSLQDAQQLLHAYRND